MPYKKSQPNIGVIVELPDDFDITKPMDYNHIPGFFHRNDMNFYRDMAYLANNGDHYVEIGTWLGRSAAVMINEFRKLNKKVRFDVIDHFESISPEAIETGKQIGLETEGKDLTPGTKDTIKFMYDQFIAYMKACDVLRDMNPIISKSVEGAKLYEDESLDFVNIDANHDYEYIYEDVIAWYPKVKIGKIIAGHDIQFDGVSKALNELLRGQYMICGTSWYCYKLDTKLNIN